MPKATKYFIWSYRNRSWYRSDRAGYTDHVAAAGEYDATEAADIVLSGLPGGCVAVDTFFKDRIPPDDPHAVEKYLDELKRI